MSRWGHGISDARYLRSRFKEETGTYTRTGILPQTVWDKPKLIIENTFLGPDRVKGKEWAAIYLFVSYTARMTKQHKIKGQIRARVGRNGCIHIDGKSEAEVYERLQGMVDLPYVSVFKELPKQNLNTPRRIEAVLRECLRRRFSWMTRGNFGEEDFRW